MTNPHSNFGETVDAEAFVRECFEEAVGRIDVRTTDLVAAGMGKGRRLRRQRRITQAVGAFMTVGMIGAGGVAASSLTDNGASRPATGRPTGTPNAFVPSNPFTLSRLVQERLPRGIVAGDTSVSEPRPGSFRFRQVGRWFGHGFRVSVLVQPTTTAPELLACASPHVSTSFSETFCGLRSLDAGGRARLVSSQGVSPAVIQGFRAEGASARVLAVRPDCVLRVVVSVSASEPDGTTQGLASPDKLAGIALGLANDRSIGTTTSRSSLVQPPPTFGG